MARRRVGVSAAAALAALVMIVAGPVGVASGLTVSTFAGGQAAHLVTFAPGGGVDTSATVSVAKDSVIRAATVRVEGAGDSQGHYPWDVEVFADAPSNSTKIYSFSGPAYGAMGRQTLYDTGTDALDFRFRSGGSAYAAVLLPKGATINGASMTVVGGGFNQGYSGPDFLNQKVGSNFVQLDTGFRAAPYLADIDGDGDLDLFAAGANYSSTLGYAGGPRFFRNVGNASAYQFSEEPSIMSGVTQGYGISPALADLDADGDLDLLVVGGLYQGVSWNVSYYRNTGTKWAPTWTRDNTTFSGITTDGFAHAALGDVDGDGLTDVVFGSSSGSLTFFRNTGNSTSPAWTASNLLAGVNVGQYSAPALADMDADGDLDLVVGNGTFVGPTGGGYSGLTLFEQAVGPSGAPTFIPRATFSGLHIGGSYTSALVVPYLGDLDADGDLDIQVGDYFGQYWRYTGNFALPSSVVLDVGADGSADWSYSAPLFGPQTASGLGPAFTTALGAMSANFTDSWGNAMAAVPVRVATATAGFLSVRSLSVIYSYSPISADFAGTLNQVRQAGTADASGNVSMALPVSSTTAGVVSLKFLSVVVDLPPTSTGSPSASLLEDTKVDDLLDLAGVFEDDFTSDLDLQFAVVSNSLEGTVAAYITAGRWLGVDALTGAANDNWNGVVNLTVRATDEAGLTATVAVPVVVVPVNDAPTLGGVSPSYTVNEDEPWELIPAGADVDGDTLVWAVAGKPVGASFDPASGALRWTPRQGDVGVHSFTISVSDGTVEVQAAVVVTVVNVNDPPFLRPIPDQTALEGVLLSIDLAPYYGDEDDPMSALTLQVAADHGRLSGTVLTFSFEKGSGVGIEKVRVTVIDPHGAAAEATFAVTVVPAGPELALVGVPDLQVVESVPKTIDVAPYVHNVKAWANLSLSASSPQASVSGTRVTFLYPVGHPADTERVRLTAREGGESANWTIVVTVVRLGSTLLLVDLPDIDVVEGLETVLELAPYLHNVDPSLPLALESDSPYARFSGTRLLLTYPVGSGVTADEVTVRAVQGSEASADTLSVRVHQVQAHFYLDPIPALNAVEGQPLVLFVAPFVHNADDLGSVSMTVASAFAEVGGLTVSFLYPVGSGVSAEQVTVVARYGSQVYSVVVSVMVASLGDAFTLAGVPNLAVFAGAPYSISLRPYLFNLGGQGVAAVEVTADSPYAHIEDGPTLVLRYPDGTSITREEVTLTARLGGEASSQTITVTVRQVGESLAIAPIPTQFVREDEPLRLDIFPYLLRAAQGSLVVAADSAFVTVTDVTWLTLLFPGGLKTASFLVTVQSGGETAQAHVAVVIEDVNDAPVFLGGELARSGASGEVVVWDLRALFGDEEDAAGLTFQASDPRVVIDAASGVARLTMPGSGEVRFTFTAADSADPSLTVTSPDAVAATVAAAPGRAHVSAGGESSLPLLALFVLLGVGLGLLQRRDAGRALGARGAGPTLTRRRS